MQLSLLGAVENIVRDTVGTDVSSGAEAPMALPQDAAVQTIEPTMPQVDSYPPREYFILTHAGKPVFARYAFHTAPGWVLILLQSTSNAHFAP